MTLLLNRNDLIVRFVSCAGGGSLLQVLLQAVVCRRVGKLLWIFQPAFIFTATPHQHKKGKNNLTLQNFSRQSFAAENSKQTK
jgi:hypothetical protein